MANENIESIDWEAICERCGRCCYEKYDYRGKVFYSKTPCQHLDTSTRLCRIYERRLELRADCAQLTPDLVRSGILPEDCPYVKKLVTDPAELREKQIEEEN